MLLHGLAGRGKIVVMDPKVYDSLWRFLETWDQESSVYIKRLLLLSEDKWPASTPPWYSLERKSRFTKWTALEETVGPLSGQGYKRGGAKHIAFAEYAVIQIDYRWEDTNKVGELRHLRGDIIDAI